LWCILKALARNNASSVDPSAIKCFKMLVCVFDCDRKVRFLPLIANVLVALATRHEAHAPVARLEKLKPLLTMLVGQRLCALTSNSCCTLTSGNSCTDGTAHKLELLPPFLTINVKLQYHSLSPKLRCTRFGRRWRDSVSLTDVW